MPHCPRLLISPAIVVVQLQVSIVRGQLRHALGNWSMIQGLKGTVAPAEGSLSNVLLVI